MARTDRFPTDRERRHERTAGREGDHRRGGPATGEGKPPRAKAQGCYRHETRPDRSERKEASGGGGTLETPRSRGRQFRHKSLLATACVVGPQNPMEGPPGPRPRERAEDRSTSQDDPSRHSSRMAGDAGAAWTLRQTDSQARSPPLALVPHRTNGWVPAAPTSVSPARGQPAAASRTSSDPAPFGASGCQDKRREAGRLRGATRGAAPRGDHDASPDREEGNLRAALRLPPARASAAGARRARSATIGHHGWRSWA